MRHQPPSLAKLPLAGNASPSHARCGLVVLPALMALLSVGTARGEQAAPDPNQIVIRVGPIEVSLEDLSDSFHDAARSDTTLGPNATSVSRFVDSFVETLLGQTWALRDSSVVDARLRDMVDLREEMLIKEALRKHLMPRYVKADEAVLRAVYDRMGTELDLSVIRVSTLVELDSVQAELKRGVPFGEVAGGWSGATSTGERSGPIGWVGALRLPPDLQEILWSLPDGGVSPPVPSPAYYSVFCVLGRRPSPPRKDFESERSNILTEVSVSQLGKAAGEIHDDLMAGYHYRVDMEAAEWMRAFLQKETASARRTYDPAIDKSVARFDEPREPPFWKEAPLKGEEAGRPVAFIDGDTLPAIEVIDQLVFEPTLVWPTFENVGDVLELCDEALYERVQIREARRLGLDKDPIIQHKVATQRRQLIWRAYRWKKIVPGIRASEEELRIRYERELARFSLPERRRYVVVSMPTMDLARQAETRLKAGLAPSTIVEQMHAPGLTIAVTPDTGLGWVTYGSTPLGPAIFSLRKGGVSQPFPDRGRFAVMRVDDVLLARTQSFDEVRTQLEKEIIAEREPGALAEIVAKARPLCDVWIDREAIARMDFKPFVFERRDRQRAP